MSREDAATVYLDVAFGRRVDYDQYLRAAEALSEADKHALAEACGRRMP